MNFIPETPKDNIPEVPYYDDVTSENGWQGMSTTKSIERLQGEVKYRLDRLNGIVRRFQPGQFHIGDHVRDGYRIHYFIEAPTGELISGRLDIVALPVRINRLNAASEKKRRESSLKMALYMLEISLAGIWFLARLSPGYAPLMPFMLADGEKTVSQLWSESAVMSRLLPPGESDFVDGEIVR